MNLRSERPHNSIGKNLFVNLHAYNNKSLTQTIYYIQQNIAESTGPSFIFYPCETFL